MITLKTIGRNAVLFAIGGTIYYMIELIWRGYSSLPMVLVGGLCFLFCGFRTNVYQKTRQSDVSSVKRYCSKCI